MGKYTAIETVSYPHKTKLIDKTTILLENLLILIIEFFLMTNYQFAADIRKLIAEIDPPLLIYKNKKGRLFACGLS